MNAIAWKAAAGAAVLAFTGAAGAAVNPTPGGYSQVIAFGDSLSDNGNLYALTGTPASPPYFAGRFSNGPVAVETLAARLGEPLIDYAYGGAGTGVRNEAVFAGNPGAPAVVLNTGMLSQFAAYQATLGAAPQADPNALYFLWGGANDLRYGQFAPAVTEAALGNLESMARTLLAQGARHLLLPLLPDIGLTPEARAATGGSPNPVVSFLTDAFNDRLLARYQGLAELFPQARVTIFDTFAAHRDINANAAAYGFSDVSTTCLRLPAGAPPSVCVTPDAWMYWDGVHPTAAMHDLVADRFIAALAVPEPDSVLLLGAAIALLTAVSARVRRGPARAPGRTGTA